MMNQEDKVFLKGVFIRNGIDQLLGLKGKYFDAFIDVMSWSYRNTDTINFTNSRYQRVGNFFFKTLVVIGGAVISAIKYMFSYSRYNPNCIKSNVIVVPFCDVHVRYKYIYDLIGDVSVIYPPLFHYQHVKRHIDCFENQGHHIMIGHFSFKDILSVAVTVLKNYARLKQSHKDIEKYFSRDYGYFISAFIVSMLYKKYINNLMSTIKDDSSTKKWLFDYDFDYKYIIFNNEIKEHCHNDITFHVQHGAFFGYEVAYCNPISDVSLCCSPREKAIIEKYNNYNCLVYPIGSSLQSIDLEKVNEISETYDILVLLTDTILAETADFQKKLLFDLSKSDFHILVRYRPQSAQFDKEILGGFTVGMSVSSGRTLKQDILSARMIICFSEDAIYECFRNKKKVVYIVGDASHYDFSYAHLSGMQIITPNDYTKATIENGLKNRNCDYTDDHFVKYNFGDFDFEKLKQNLHSILEL